MKTRKLILPLSLALLGGMVLSGCGKEPTPTPTPTPTPSKKTDYDMSGVKFNDTTVDYTGSAITVAVTGELPAGLSASYKYYSDTAHTSEVASVVDAGTYYCVASFQGDEAHNPVTPMNATLTVNKIDVDVPEFEIVGTRGAETEEIIASKNGDNYFVEFNTETKYPWSFTCRNKATKEEITMLYYDDEGNEILEPTGDDRIINLHDHLNLGIQFDGDKNHNEVLIKTTLSIEKKTYMVSTYEDLVLMAKHMSADDDEFIESDMRRPIRYVLANDIDCEGQIWDVTHIAPEATTLLTGEDGWKFNSEFDGNGHSIKNLTLSATAEHHESVGFISNTMGTGIGEARTLAMFPIANGSNIHDITFDGFHYVMDKTYSIAAGSINGGLHIGIIGLERQTKEGEEETELNRNATYSENVVVKNTVVDVETDYDFLACNSGGKYFLSVGGFVGLAANAASPQRDAAVCGPVQYINVDVENMEVNLDIPSGCGFIGGVVGYCAYEANIFKNCDTDATFNLTNHGAAIAANTAYTEAVYARGTGGSFFSVGGIYGSQYKPGDFCKSPDGRNLSKMENNTSDITVNAYVNGEGNLVAGQVIGLAAPAAMQQNGGAAFALAGNECSVTYNIYNVATEEAMVEGATATHELLSMNA